MRMDERVGMRPWMSMRTPTAPAPMTMPLNCTSPPSDSTYGQLEGSVTAQPALLIAVRA